MLPSADTTFNYAALPTDMAASARAAAERIRGRLAGAIIETGIDLMAQKDSLGHGNFLKWIDAEFGLSERTAQKFMSIAREIGPNAKDSSHLSFEALAKLAAPSTPEPVRTEVLERAASGERVTAKESEALKRKLTSAEEKIAEKEEQRRAQESLAKIAERQVSDATNRAMFAEADKERLAEELEAAQIEIEKLRESDTIHVMPADTFRADKALEIIASGVINRANPLLAPKLDVTTEVEVAKTSFLQMSPEAKGKFREWIIAQAYQLTHLTPTT